MDCFVPSSEVRRVLDAAGADLREDFRLLLELMHRFERTDDHLERQDLMRAATDLFEIHAAIQHQIGGTLRGTAAHRVEALHGLMERLDATDARSPLHYAGGLELKRMLERYVSRNDHWFDGMSKQARRMQCNAGLWHERAGLLSYARQLVTLH